MNYGVLIRADSGYCVHVSLVVISNYGVRRGLHDEFTQVIG